MSGGDTRENKTQVYARDYSDPVKVKLISMAWHKEEFKGNSGFEKAEESSEVGHMEGEEPGDPF